MHKPTRKVMSMVPNQQYLHGYNDCVKETEGYNRDVIELFVAVLKAHCPPEALEESGLKAKVVDFLLEESHDILSRYNDTRVSGAPINLTREDRLELMLRRVLHAQKPKVNTSEERVLRKEAHTLLGDPLADYISASDYDVDLDKQRMDDQDREGMRDSDEQN